MVELAEFETDGRASRRLDSARLVDGVEGDAGMGDRWHGHQNAGDDKEDPCHQPATKTTSHNVHLPPSVWHRGAMDQSRTLKVMPAWEADGMATKKPETTKKIPAINQPRTRRVITLTSLPPSGTVDRRISQGR